MHTFADPLRRALQASAARTAVIDGEKRFTYADLHDRCARLGGGLAGLGLRRGDRVAILAANCHQYVETYAQATACDTVLFNRFFHAMLERGVYLAPSAFEAGFMSNAHSEQDIADTLQAARESFRVAKH